MNKITPMGHVLSTYGIGPLLEKIKSLLDVKEPNNAAEIRSFLGGFNFSARFITNLATVAESLRRLIIKKKGRHLSREKNKADF